MDLTKEPVCRAAEALGVLAIVDTSLWAGATRAPVTFALAAVSGEATAGVGGAESGIDPPEGPPITQVAPR